MSLFREKREAKVKSPFKHPYWGAFGGIGPKILCKDEWKIIELSNLIRDKPDWQKKYKDEAITSKWKQEYIDQMKGETKYASEIVDFVLEELAWYEKVANNTSGFQCGCHDSIVFSDTSVESKLRDQFVKLAEQLEELFDGKFDYHPGSNEQVVDLVHPSLWPLQYGITPIKVGDKYEIVEFSDDISLTKHGVAPYGESKYYQWLPALMKFEDGKLNFSSYINNLHPIKFKDLYGAIADIFNAVLPGLNFTLSRYASPQYIRRSVPGYSDPYTDEYRQKLKDLWGSDRDDIDEAYEVLEAQKPNYVKPLIPKYTGEPETVLFDLKDFDSLKVIVKMAYIELTPEKPKYAGGSWHVEGTINEDIVATVLYYYDTENINESRLSFRTGYEDPEYEQDDRFFCKEFFGVEDEDEMVTNMGSVEAKQGRVVVFPNFYQHHVDAFELADDSKKGHRKILCFFVVDPNNHLVKTTAEVPPQQEQWWNEGLEGLTDEAKASILKLKDDWPQTLEAAKEVREKLMKERSVNQQEFAEDDMGGFARRFSLCEH